MDGLTDLEICKRIAEIECVEHLSDRGVIILSEDYSDLINTICSGRYAPVQVERIVSEAAYSPLTDDGLCFRLMVKYAVMIEQWGVKFLAYYKAELEENDVLEYQSSTESNTPNKAICLAIIEAHKD